MDQSIDTPSSKQFCRRHRKPYLSEAEGKLFVGQDLGVMQRIPCKNHRPDRQASRWTAHCPANDMPSCGVSSVISRPWASRRMRSGFCLFRVSTGSRSGSMGGFVTWEALSSRRSQ